MLAGFPARRLREWVRRYWRFISSKMSLHDLNTPVFIVHACLHLLQGNIQDVKVVEFAVLGIAGHFLPHSVEQVDVFLAHARSVRPQHVFVLVAFRIEDHRRSRGRGSGRRSQASPVSFPCSSA